MYLTIPLSLTAEIMGFNSKPINSWAHEIYTTDVSNGSLIWPYKQYKSSPHTPPRLEIQRHHPETPLAGGYLFVSPSDTNGKDGTMELQGTGFVMTDKGDLVYAAEEFGMGFCTQYVSGMTDFRQQDYDGRPYIVYWNGCNTKGTHWGHRWGRVTLVDDTYENFTINPELHVTTGDPANIGQIDVHEHELVPGERTILLSSYTTVPWDLSRFGGAVKSWIADSLFFEVDVETQNVLFEWSASDHIPVRRSRMPGAAHGTEKRPWDWFHINSVQKIGSNYLISSRHVGSVFLISGADGSVLWELDGMSGGDFGAIPDAGRFRWQHHARAHNVTDDGMIVSVFSNFVNGEQTLATQTRGVALRISLPPNRNDPVTVHRSLGYNAHPLFSATQGSYQMDIGGGHGFIGYGSTPVAREFSPSGDLLWTARFGRDGAVQSYRATKQPWHGTPKHWDPSLVLERSAARSARAYMSWNGATEISAWAVYAGERADQLVSVGVAAKKGFETTFELKPEWRCVKVGGVREGRILRASNTACLDEG